MTDRPSTTYLTREALHKAYADGYIGPMEFARQDHKFIQAGEPAPDVEIPFEPATTGVLVTGPREVTQGERAVAVASASKALQGRGSGFPGGTVVPANVDDVARLADYIITGNYASPRTPIPGIVTIPNADGLIPLTHDQLQELIREARKAAWYEGYAQRPLFDGQNLGNPRAINPYDDNPDLSTADWSQPEGSRGTWHLGKPEPAWAPPVPEDREPVGQDVGQDADPDFAVLVKSPEPQPRHDRTPWTAT